MSLLQSAPTTRPAALGAVALRSTTLRRDELEQVFRDWADDEAHPDVITAGRHRGLRMVRLAQLLRDSDATLATSTSAGLGLGPGATIADASAALLWATVDPDGPRCRSFRAATFFLRGLVLLDAEPEPGPGPDLHVPSRRVRRMRGDRS